MDLTYSADEEQFRQELRSWLAESIPAEWREPTFWADLTPAESFKLRRVFNSQTILPHNDCQTLHERQREVDEQSA